jgi:cysteine desulfurase/selenocysteine lyase
MVGNTQRLKRKFDISDIRKDFPAIIQCNSDRQSIVYLDNAATTQKPQCVINTLVDFYGHYNANVHRSYYDWGQRSTEAYEGTRKRLANFINADSADEIVFTHGATESLNALAEIIGQRYLQPNDEIIVSELEHHSNIIPWQMQQSKRGVIVKGWSLEEDGSLNIERLDSLLTPKTKLLAFSHLSNVLGTIPPVKEIIKRAHSNNTLVVVDATQALAHLQINVKTLDCDFLVGSAHKAYGPMGAGFFYGKRDLLESLPPYLGGGTMMETVTIDSFTPSEVPLRFEAGTPPVADIIGFGIAIDYLQQFDWHDLLLYEDDVLQYAVECLSSLPYVRIAPCTSKRTAVISFLVDGLHPHDVVSLVCDDNIAMRAGFHCCQPLMKRLNYPSGLVRASFGLYNTHEDIDRLILALDRAVMVFKK